MAATELEIGDSRVEFIADYVLKALKLKPDRWTKMYQLDENRQLCVDFFDKPDRHNLVFLLNAAGGLTVASDWPTTVRSKAVYFVKRAKEALPKDVPVKSALLYGDISYSPIDQLSAFVDEVHCSVLTF